MLNLDPQAFHSQHHLWIRWGSNPAKILLPVARTWCLRLERDWIISNLYIFFLLYFWWTEIKVLVLDRPLHFHWVPGSKILPLNCLMKRQSLVLFRLTEILPAPPAPTPPTPSVLKTHTVTVFSAAAVTQLIEQGFYSPIIILKTSQALKQQEDDWWFRQSYWQTQAAPQPLHRGRGAGRRVIHYTSQHLGGGREKGGGQTTGKQQNTNIISTVPK